MTDPKDTDLWHAATRDVKPLSVRSRKKPTGISVRETVTAPPGPGRPRHRRGEMTIEARLDLHGLRQKDAQETLKKFITRCHRQGKRCVLVVTGKGHKRTRTDNDDWWESKPGVLRESLPRWLAQGMLAELVLSVRPARSKDGGEGAFYVRLRRSRA